MFQNGEIEQVMSMFEQPSQQKTLPYTGSTLGREDRQLWKKGNFYQHGRTNDQFKAFLCGYSFGKVVGRDQ